jgi:hypothetical protein
MMLMVLMHVDSLKAGPLAVKIGDGKPELAMAGATAKHEKEVEEMKKQETCDPGAACGMDLLKMDVDGEQVCVLCLRRW